MAFLLRDLFVFKILEMLILGIQGVHLDLLVALVPSLDQGKQTGGRDDAA